MALVQLDTDNTLAIDGAAPIRTAPFAPWPSFTEDEVAPVAAVLRSGRVNYWTGDEGRRFESEFAESHGCAHGVALANGTVALEAALRAVGVGVGHEVVVTSRTFVASATSVLMVGAEPIFAEIDRDSQNLHAGSILAMLTPRTKAVVAVHLVGWPCEMDAIIELAEEHGIAVIEDCAQAQGARIHKRPVGSLGHAAAFSFCQDKIFTTGGEGGMVTTNDPDIWKRVWSLRDHGKSYDTVHRQDHPPGFRWLHEGIGSNWRLTEMQSAMGRVLLKKLSAFVETRRRYAGMLNDAFADVPGLRVTRPPDHVEHAYYKYHVFVEPDQLLSAWDRDRIMVAVGAEGVPCYSGSCSEIYRERVFGELGLEPASRHPVARELGETSLMFLVHPTLTEDDMRDTVAAVRKVMAVATGHAA
jgi:hypothetical protein